jgi:hypothetical protein
MRPLQRRRQPPVIGDSSSIIPRRFPTPSRRPRADLALERLIFEPAPGHLHRGADPQAPGFHMGMLQGVQGEDLPEHSQEKGEREKSRDRVSRDCSPG